MSENTTSIIAALRPHMSADQWQRLIAELHARQADAYHRGYAAGQADGRTPAQPEAPARPLISDQALAIVRGALRSSTMRIGALISMASAALLDDALRAQVLELLGPRAGPVLGMAAGIAMVVQRVRTVMSLAQRGGRTGENTGA